MSVSQSPPDPHLVRGTTVSVGTQAALICGASGTGKSSLALQMIALGATLVSDDYTALARSGTQLLARSAPNIGGQIEARHAGLLTLPYCTEAQVAFTVDLDETEQERIPPKRLINYLGISVPLFRRFDGPHLAATLVLKLRTAAPNP